MTNFYNDRARRALCSLSLGSMTQALRAKRLLGRSDISANVKKLSTSNSARGCVYGIEFPCEISGNVRLILNDNGMGEGV